jgi:iron complex outermembrane receptor protein
MIKSAITALLGSVLVAVPGTELLAAAAATDGAAAAGAAPTTDAGGGDSSGLEEITVTAQRRSESLERTPLAVSVITPDLLAKRNITTESDLQFAAPGLIVRAGQNSNALNYAIRGESLDPFSNTRPGVLPYFNEIQVSSSGGSSAFYDLQSVQVLKGPQGTLFGRNSTGGAVLFTTNKPTDEFGGYGSIRFGNFSQRQFEGALNVPVVPGEVLLRVAAISQYRDGFQENQNVNNFGQRLGDVRRNGARVTLTVRPWEQLENTTVFDYLHSGGSPMTSVLYSLDPNGPIGTIAGSAGALPQFADLNAFLAAQRALGPYKPNVDGSTFFNSRNLVISNITSYKLTDDTQIRNIFGFSNIDQVLYSDTDGSPYQIDDNGIVGSADSGGKRDRNKQYSEELQLVGSAHNHLLTYTVGMYYAHERVVDFTTSRLLGLFLGSTGGGNPLVTQYNTAQTGGETYAGYGQATLDLGEMTGDQGLSATAGARYSSERTLINVLPPQGTPGQPGYTPGDNSYLAPQPNFDYNQAHTYNNVSWMAGLQQQINSDLMVYLDTRRSFRNGGFNGFVLPVPGLGAEGGNRYDAERLQDIELGSKFQGLLFTLPVRLNIAVYQSWIDNAQRAASVLVGGAPAAITVNVPKARVRGFELDGVVNPTSWLNLGASANYTDAKNTDNLVSIAGASPVRFGTYPDAPRWSGTAFAELTAPVGGSLKASLRGDVYAQQSTWFVAVGNIMPGTQLPGYGLANFRLGLENEKQGWSVSANVKNAFDKTYYVGGEALGLLFQDNMVNPGDRRTYSIEARMNF